MFSNNIKGITYSLSPIKEKSSKLEDYSIIPQSNIRRTTQKRKINQSVNAFRQGSRKYRLLQQRNTEIEKDNRMLYEKIRKIMQKGHHSVPKIQQQQQGQEIKQKFMNTQLKALSLPYVSTPREMRSTAKSQLTDILNNRNTYVDTYFQGIQKIRNNPGKTQQLGNYSVGDWKIHALLIDDSYVLLNGKKGKKDLTKKYLWDRVKPKWQENFQEWVQSKFEFEL